MGVPASFIPSNIGEVSVDEFTLRRSTNDTPNPKLLDTAGREQAVGHYGHATWNLQKRNFGHAPNSFGPRLPFSAPCPSRFYFQPSSHYFTFDRRIEISGATTDRGIQFWINGVINWIYLFIFHLQLTTSKIENPCWSIPFWIKRKRIKNSINTYILVI